MANTLAPYKRVDDWNDLIKRINEQCENPPEGMGCEPVEPLEEAEPNHIWTRQDIERARDKLKELCKDSEFEAPLDKWILQIHDELEEALKQAWCDCECLEPCDNASEDPEIIYIGTQTAVGCEDGECGDCPDQEANNQLEQTLVQLFDEMEKYEQHWPQYCELEEQVEKLEDELEQLEKELEDLEEIKNRDCAEVSSEAQQQACAEATAAVEEKQKEVDDKQKELDEKKAERDEEKEKAEDALEKMDQLASATFAQSHAANNQPACGYHSLANYVPQITRKWTNTECDKLPPINSCFGSDPTRCAVFWTLQKRVVESWAGDCRSVAIPCPYTGFFAIFECIAWRREHGGYTWEHLPPINLTGQLQTWQPVLRGGFTPNGKMYVSSNDCAQYSDYAMSSTNCSDPYIACVAPDTYQVYEYRLSLRYNTETKKTNCDGEECVEK